MSEMHVDRHRPSSRGGWTVTAASRVRHPAIDGLTGDAELATLESKLAGVFAPICTPFDAREEVDDAALQHNLARYAQSGILGFLTLGSNGENRSLTEEERLHVLGPDHALPPWDFADTESGIIDSSALAIAIAGFLCLAGLPGLSRYRQRAGHMLERLAALAVIGDREEPGLLAHGTFSRKLGVGVNASLIFGDFYFLDALGRYLGLPHADFLRPSR